MSCTKDEQEPHGWGDGGLYMQGGAENEAADEGLSEVGGVGREQTPLAEARHSCRGNMVRILSQLNKSIPLSVDRRKGYLSTACWIRLIQLFRSSLELV